MRGSAPGRTRHMRDPMQAVYHHQLQAGSCLSAHHSFSFTAVLHTMSLGWTTPAGSRRSAAAAAAPLLRPGLALSWLPATQPQPWGTGLLNGRGKNAEPGPPTETCSSSANGPSCAAGSARRRNGAARMPSRPLSPMPPPSPSACASHTHARVYGRRAAADDHRHHTHTHRARSLISHASRVRAQGNPLPKFLLVCAGQTPQRRPGAKPKLHPHLQRPPRPITTHSGHPETPPSPPGPPPQARTAAKPALRHHGQGSTATHVRSARRTATIIAPQPRQPNAQESLQGPPTTTNQLCPPHTPRPSRRVRYTTTSTTRTTPWTPTTSRPTQSARSTTRTTLPCP